MTEEEEEFWKAVYLVHIKSYGPHGAALYADDAVEELRKRGKR